MFVIDYFIYKVIFLLVKVNRFAYRGTGVIQKVLPVLSTETLLHIWLSTEYYGFRSSSTAVDTGIPGVLWCQSDFLGIFCYFSFRICF